MFAVNAENFSVRRILCRLKKTEPSKIILPGQ